MNVAPEQLYLPTPMRIDSLVDEAPDTRTLRLSFVHPDKARAFSFKPGQFVLVSVFGAGESALCIASPPRGPNKPLECTFKAVGKVTRALRSLEAGDCIGLRGPYGNSFPLDRMEQHPILFAGGGIGMAPVRSALLHVLDRRDRFGAVSVIHGARTVRDLLYRSELDSLARRPDVDLRLTVDPGGEEPGWAQDVGFVPDILKKLPKPGKEAFAILCGPPVMIKAALPVLANMGLEADRIFTTLENRMTCGIGKCARCNIGPSYVCKDGPVYSAAQLVELPADF